MPLKVKKLNPLATLPTVAHPGEDLAYDLYALRVVHQPVNADGTPATYTPPSAGLPVRLDLTGKMIHPIRLEQGKPTKVPTGVALHFTRTAVESIAEGDAQPGAQLVSIQKKYGLLIRDRSSLAARGITISGGVIDEGYRGEVSVILNQNVASYVDLWPGDKIAQIIPVEVLTDEPVQEVAELDESERKEAGFGSTGQ